jgi:hypothetical protein
MTEALITLGTMALIALMYWMGRSSGGSTAVVEIEGVEVFRGEATVAEQALHILCDGGVAAWLEDCDDQHVAIHVEESDLGTVRQVLQESGLLHA